MIEDLRIIAKDGGRLSADDRRLIGTAADALEDLEARYDRLGIENATLAFQVRALEERLANAPEVCTLVAPAVFDQASYHALASRLCGGYIIAKPGEKPW